MPNQSWGQVLAFANTDGPTLTAAAAASCLPAGGKIALGPGFFFYPGQMLHLFAHGRISVVATTPGTARFDFRLGGTVVFDTGALNLNTAGKTTVPWWLEIYLTVRAIGAGTTANLMGVGNFQSEAVIGSPAPTAGGNGGLLAPVGTPAVGGGFDSTASLTTDLFFTQTVATGSLTLHTYKLISLN